MRTLRSTATAAVPAALAFAVLSVAPTATTIAQTADAPASALQSPLPSAAPGAAGKGADPVVAKVSGDAIHLSDLSEAAQSLPAEYRNMPSTVLYPMLLDRMIDQKAIVDLARKQKLDQDPMVQRQMARAGEQALQSALLARDVGPQVSDQAVHARYDADIAGKPTDEEVHARHILVGSEAEANKIIAELKKGGDFAALAKAHSTDPGAAQGGDLGFFKKGDMLPEFSDAAFALQPGQISDKPVKTQYGWHIIKLEERRALKPPTFEQARDELRQKMIHEGVEKVVAEARAGVSVEKFNPDGTPQRATDAAEPPPPRDKK
jgi:peptidyl-prolyl cis-trans isomerase C